MNPERWARIKALFSDALEIPEAERDALLARHAGDDPGLVEEVNSLLAAHVTAGNFLDSVDPGLRSAAFEDQEGAKAGERIGAYRLEALVGTPLR